MELFTASNVAIGMVVAMGVILGVEWNIRRRRRAHRRLVETYVQVIGVVTYVQVIETFESGSAYTPVIEYAVPNGQRYATNGESSSSPDVEIGSEVLLAYDPAMPSTAIVVDPPSWKRQFSFGDVLAFALITIVAAAVVGFVRRW
jgi:hypothetical protein